MYAPKVYRGAAINNINQPDKSKLALTKSSKYVGKKKDERMRNKFYNITKGTTNTNVNPQPGSIVVSKAKMLTIDQDMVLAQLQSRNHSNERSAIINTDLYN